MSEPVPFSAGEIVVGCVTENNAKYLGQALRLAQSIRWFGGELAKCRIVAGVVGDVDARARRSLEAYGVDVRVVPRFRPYNNPSANRLQIFDELRGSREQTFLLLDCDIIVVRDPLPLLRRGVFHAKIAPLPTVTHEVFERLFAHFGLPLPARTHVTGYTGTPTIPYFNAGVIAIPAPLARRLAPEWRLYNGLLAADPSLVHPCEKNMHQAALAIALAVSGIPTAEAGAELNYQINATHLPPPPGYLDIDPYLIHYHHLVDDDGFLLPTKFPRAQARIDQFHARLREERSRDIGLHRHRPAATSSPKQIAVIGMHRSGTSLVGRLLNAMGCYAGEEEEMPAPDVFNPTGYWEHRDVWSLDEEMLTALDASWLEPDRADVTTLAADVRAAFTERARAIVRTFDAQGSWMMKDPRLALLFPLWRDALERPVCVLAWREPLAVARSLAQRDGLPLALGLALWEEYTRTALASTIGLPRVAVAYHRLVADPVGTMTKLHRDLVAAGATDLSLPPNDELLAMIDPKLDRHGGDDEGLLNRHQAELAAALRSGAALEWTSVPPVHPDTRALIAAATHDRRTIAALKDGAEQLELLLDATYASRSWRIGFGLTRLWRRVRPTGEETAVERWARQSRPSRVRAR